MEGIATPINVHRLQNPNQYGPKCQTNPISSQHLINQYICLATPTHFDLILPVRHPANKKYYDGWV